MITHVSMILFLSGSSETVITPSWDTKHMIMFLMTFKNGILLFYSVHAIKVIQYACNCRGNCIKIRIVVVHVNESL